jgi:hypothetical protein
MDFGPSPSTRASSSRRTGVAFFNFSYSVLRPLVTSSSIISAIDWPTPGISLSALMPPFAYDRRHLFLERAHRLRRLLERARLELHVLHRQDTRRSGAGLRRRIGWMTSGMTTYLPPLDGRHEGTRLFDNLSRSLYSPKRKVAKNVEAPPDRIDTGRLWMAVIRSTLFRTLPGSSGGGR